MATCNATNFFIVTGREVWTSTGEHCLNGITRRLVLQLAVAAGIGAHERDFTLDDVYRADEAFVTGTFGALTPVAHVDGHAIGDGTGFGPITRQLAGQYRDAMDRAARP